MTTCPIEYVGELWEAVPDFEMMEQGFLPLAGGVWDQPAWLMNAFRVWRAECQAFEADAARTE